MTDWQPLKTALRRARSAGLPLPIWWRDDDAIAPTAQLDQLHDLSEAIGVPVHLAVIPAYAEPTLATYMAARPNLTALVHGWAHENHAAAGQKSSEFPTQTAATIKRAQSGLTQIRCIFGADALPIFVPPWNRMSFDLANDLKGLGYRAISTFGPRSNTLPLPLINTHIDPIFWRGDRGLADPDLLIALASDHINSRIEGRADATEPLGYLTHHLVHNTEIWSFSQAFLGELLEGGATPADIAKLA